jgi:hypothetical protein
MPRTNPISDAHWFWAALIAILVVLVFLALLIIGAL